MNYTVGDHNRDLHESMQSQVTMAKTLSSIYDELNWKNRLEALKELYRLQKEGVYDVKKEDIDETVIKLIKEKYKI